MAIGLEAVPGRSSYIPEVDRWGPSDFSGESTMRVGGMEAYHSPSGLLGALPSLATILSPVSSGCRDPDLRLYPCHWVPVGGDEDAELSHPKFPVVVALCERIFGWFWWKFGEAGSGGSGSGACRRRLLWWILVYNQRDFYNPILYHLSITYYGSRMVRRRLRLFYTKIWRFLSLTHRSLVAFARLPTVDAYECHLYHLIIRLSEELGTASSATLRQELHATQLQPCR
ncbi:hypothetical protein N657DRAFT_67877 [Parathielavia appendiculata]|uniref:Uncharacterized protein n=1 Tax=Parathielavia appendiculata TaxID=2587402 RepID=A0AAN6Z9K6_9PEZI|nr:hypothetical protein N657DRAFT_67877 [Parathielavia appendiculata]